MYSLTETKIYSLHPIEENEPQLKIRCRCNRLLIQEEIFTCLACSQYSCHYCTIPECPYYQCRSCKKIYESLVKHNKCTSCFSCPYCQNVLSLMNEPKTKFFILFCQFCYWSSREVSIKEQSSEALLESINKQSMNLKESENKIYNFAWTFFKESNMAIQTENQAIKYITTPKRNYKRSFIEDSQVSNRQQIDKLEKNASLIIKHCSLTEQNEEFNGFDSKFPQGLTLLTKKTRRCPNPSCSKPLTNIYRPSPSNELKIQLVHKDLKVLQVQRTPPVDNQVHIRCLRSAVINGKLYEAKDITTVPMNVDFEVEIAIDNRTRRKTTNITYKFVVQTEEHKRLV